MSFYEVKKLCKKFDKTEVLKGIDFTLEKGEVLSIIGSSGSGKTTLLRCLNFLETADNGKIILNGETLFDGDEVKKYKEKDLRDIRLKMGLVFQSFNLFPQYTLRENVALAPKLLANEKLKSKKATKEEREVFYENIYKEVDSLIEKVGLSDKIGLYPSQLSGGQCQRVAIARALALKPAILCFDEPTSALDPELTGEVLKVIKSLKGGDMTMIIVTHEMEFAKNISDKVVFMADGVVEEEGTAEEIFICPKNAKVKQFLQNYLKGGKND